MSEGLQIVISADVNQFTKNLQTAEKATQNFSKNVTKNTSQASFALTNFGRVAQDIPFGFIAIQNNISPLIESFSNLQKSTGSAGAAFKAIGAEILGPAGALVALSVVTSAITTLIQKYGSISNAIKVFTSANAEATQSQLLYNKELAKGEATANVQINTLEQLSKNFNDSSKGINAQLAAFVQLKKIQPDIATGISQENALTKENIALVNQRTFGYINLLKVQAQQNAINAITAKNEEEILLKKQELITATEDYNKSLQLQNYYKGLEKKGFDISASIAENVVIDAKRQKVLKLASDIGNLVGINNTYYNQLNPLITEISNYNKAQEDASIKAKKQTTEEKEKLKVLKEQQAIIREIQGIQPNTGKDFYKNNQESLSGIERLRQFFLNYKPEKITKGLNVYPKENADKDTANFLSLKAKATGYLTELSPFIDSIFSAIQNGQNVFQALGQSVKQFAIEMVKALVKTAALAALISIFSGGKISFGTAFKGVTTVNGGLLGLGGAAAPSMGGMAGLQGGMQLAGNVVFVQRGYDLVGVLNASRGSINNVG